MIVGCRMYSKIIRNFIFPLFQMNIPHEERFITQLKFLNKTQWWSYSDLEKLQLKRLKKILHHAKENVPREVKKCNDGRLADLVILCVGVPSAVKQTLESVETGGTILFFAPTEPGVNIPFTLFDLWNKQIRMVSTYAGVSRDIKEAIELIRLKKIEVADMITHRLPMDETPNGFKLAAQAKKSIKIIIEPQK